MDQIGKSYDFKHIRAIVKRTLKITKKTPKEDYEEFICSELVAYAYKAAGLLLRNFATAMIEPAHIAKLPIVGAAREIL